MIEVRGLQARSSDRARLYLGELVTPEYDGLPVPPWVQPDWRFRTGTRGHLGPGGRDPCGFVAASW